MADVEPWKPCALSMLPAPFDGSVKALVRAALEQRQ